MESGEWNEVIGQKRYSTATATLIADDAFWDGHNYERRGRNSFLFRTPKGNYFVVYRTQWQGEQSRLEPVSVDDALGHWESMSERHVEFEEAFPGVTVEDA